MLHGGERRKINGKTYEGMTESIALKSHKERKWLQIVQAFNQVYSELYELSLLNLNDRIVTLRE